MKLKELISTYGECEVSEEMLNMIKKDNEDCEPEYNEYYWFINNDGNISRNIWGNYYSDNFRLQKRNVYRTEEEAQFALDMYNFCKERSFKPDWNDGRQYKYTICLNRINKRVSYDNYTVLNFFSPFYYPTIEVVQEVIDKYTFEELEKYYGRE